MFNCSIIGNLGKDAQMVTGKTGREMTKIVVGVTSPDKQKTYWFDVLMNHRPNLMQYLVKGMKVYVHGDLSVSAPNGYLNLNIYANEVELIGSLNSSDDAKSAVPAAVPRPGDPAPSAGAPAAPAPAVTNLGPDPFAGGTRYVPDNWDGVPVG